MWNMIKNSLSFGGFAIPIIDEICLFIDGIIYKIADMALNTFFDMAKLSGQVIAYSNEIGYIVNRVMLLSALYALFRLAIMLINYLVDPDKIKSFTGNGGSYVKNIVIAVICFVLSPLIFETLGNLTNLVIENRVIPKIIYGPDTEKSTIEDETESKKFVNNVFLLFFQPKNDCDNYYSDYCEDYNKVKYGTDVGGITQISGISTLIGYASSTNFDYTPFISGIVGIMLIYYFVSFAVSLAVRIVQLVVLQVISPIPIIMSVDPSQKNRLQTFATTYLNIYIQVFVRILTVYLAFVVLSLITNSDEIINMTSTPMIMALPILLTVLLYIGVFQSAKEIPKLIENAIGIKMGQMPGKSFGTVLKGIVGGGLGFVGGAVAGGIGAHATGRTGARGAFDVLGGVAAGGLSGMYHGGQSFASANGFAGGIPAGIGRTASAIGSSYHLGRNVGQAGGLVGYTQGRVLNRVGYNNYIDRRVTTAQERVERLTAFEQAVLADYARSDTLDASGHTVKVGGLERDNDYMMAQNALKALDYQAMHGGNPTAAQYRAADDAVKRAEMAYKKRAFNWFESQNTTVGANGRRTITYDPRKYTTLSESQRAHYDLVRTQKNRNPFVNATGSSRVADSDTEGTGVVSDFRAYYDAELKQAKKNKQDAESGQHTDRYRNSSSANGGRR